MGGVLDVPKVRVTGVEAVPGEEAYGVRVHFAWERPMGREAHDRLRAAAAEAHRRLNVLRRLRGQDYLFAADVPPAADPVARAVLAQLLAGPELAAFYAATPLMYRLPAGPRWKVPPPRAETPEDFTRCAWHWRDGGVAEVFVRPAPATAPAATAPRP